MSLKGLYSILYLYNLYLQDDKPKPQPAKSAPLRFSSTTTTTTPAPPIKNVVSEDYYYYDDSGSAPGSNNAPLTPTFQHDYHDYEYYDNIDNDEGDFKKRALQFKKFLRGVTSPMGTEGKLKYIYPHSQLVDYRSEKKKY